MPSTPVLPPSRAVARGRWPVPIADLVLTALALVVAGIEWTFVTDYGPSPVYLANGLIHTALVMALPLRRIRVVTSFVATYVLLALLAALVMWSPVNLGISPLLVCAPLSLYAVTRHARSSHWGVIGLFLGVAGSFVSPSLRLGTNYSLVAVHVLVLLATYLWAARARATAAEHRDQLLRLAEENRRRTTEQVEGAVAEERARIARELHDIVAHSLTVVQVQASTGLAIGTPEQYRESLTAVRSASGQALAEVRSLVGMLRHDSDQQPAGDLTRIPALIEDARHGGIRLAAETPEQATLVRWQQEWPATVRLTVVRAVQEGLTNVVKHGGPQTAATLRLTAVPDLDHPTRCDVQITNEIAADVRPASPAGGGHGLIGLRERATMVGGRLESGRRGERFLLHLSVPINRAK